MARQHARLQVGEQRIHRQQRLYFAGIEPQARQLKLLGAVLDLVAIAAPFAVPDDRRREAVAQVFEVALEGRRRHLERVEKLLAADDALVAQQLVDEMKTFGTIHGDSLAHKMSYRIES